MRDKKIIGAENFQNLPTTNMSCFKKEKENSINLKTIQELVSRNAIKTTKEMKSTTNSNFLHNQQNGLNSTNKGISTSR